MKLFIHSFSDVITNSSESIYISASEKSITLAKELIDYFLEEAGSDKTADDLFIFELKLDQAYVDRILDAIDENEEMVLPEDALQLFRKDIEEKERFEIVRRLVKEGKIDPDKYDSDISYREDALIIIPKDDSKEFNLASKFQRIFDISATMN